MNGMHGRRDEPDADHGGDAQLSRLYRRTATAAPPPALDRRVLAAARKAVARSPYLAPLALAASVLLSVALVLALVFGPRTARRGEEPVRWMLAAARTEAHAPAVPWAASPGKGAARAAAVPDPRSWLAQIAALRRAGRGFEADAQYRRFRAAYPGYAPGSAVQANP
jgi:hypothetical protein